MKFDEIIQQWVIVNDTLDLLECFLNKFDYDNKISDNDQQDEKQEQDLDKIEQSLLILYQNMLVVQLDIVRAIDKVRNVLGE